MGLSLNITIQNDEIKFAFFVKEWNESISGYVLIR